jgi:hypothetical protein
MELDTRHDCICWWLPHTTLLITVSLSIAPLDAQCHCATVGLAQCQHTHQDCIWQDAKAMHGVLAVMADTRALDSLSAVCSAPQPPYLPLCKEVFIPYWPQLLILQSVQKHPLRLLCCHSWVTGSGAAQTLCGSMALYAALSQGGTCQLSQSTMLCKEQWRHHAPLLTSRLHGCSLCLPCHCGKADKRPCVAGLSVAGWAIVRLRLSP